MTSLRLLCHLALADFRERTRRYSFFITLLFTIYAAYLFLPPNPSSYATLQMGGHRGIYNSAWVGTLVAVMTTLFFSLAGFYLTKNTLARDRQTGVGQIIAATPVSKLIYLAGKTLSNFFVLGLMVCTLIAVAGAMQLIRAEEMHINLFQLVMPFVVITLPAMAVVSAVAVLFESISFLRGGLGNVLFFFLWILSLSTEALDHESVMGFSVPFASMREATIRAYPEFRSDTSAVSLGFNIQEEGRMWHLKTFEWNGVEWSFSELLKRSMVYPFAFSIVLLGSFAFDRFDSSAAQSGSLLKRRKKKARRAEVSDGEIALPFNAAADAPPWYQGSFLDRITGRSRFGRMLISELKLILKGVSLWWGIAALGLIVAGACVPLDASRQFVLPFAWLWPVLLWSKMGTRETRYGTDQLMFSSPHSIRRQFPALLMAGVLIAAICGSGVAFRLVIGGEWQAFGAWVVGALFIPTAALMLGVWSGGSKLFEIVYLIVWYLGPLNKLPALDFMGTTDGNLKAGYTVIYLMLTIICFLIAVAGRKRQLAR